VCQRGHCQFCSLPCYWTLLTVVFSVGGSQWEARLNHACRPTSMGGDVGRHDGKESMGSHDAWHLCSSHTIKGWKGHSNYIHVDSRHSFNFLCLGTVVLRIIHGTVKSGCREMWH
jgi:hypothetical protein